MKILKFVDKPKLDVLLLIKQNAVFDANKASFGTNYFLPIAKALGSKIADRIAVVGTYHPAEGKVKKKEIVEFTDEIIQYALMEGVETLLVADSEYFKYLSGAKVFDKHIGESFDCVLQDCAHIKVVPMINYQTVEMFPEKKAMLDESNKTAAKVMQGESTEKAEFAFDSYELVTTTKRLEELFIEYKSYDNLACDIETTGLYVGKAELLTIAFAYDKYNAFTVPLHESYNYSNELVELVKTFLKDYTGRFIFHNGLFDVKHLVYNLFMEDFQDIDGMLEGINSIKFDDTFILAYLTLNSTVRPSLGLKDLSYDFLGDYAEDVKNALSIPLEDLAIYNAKDVCGTFYVYNKYKAALSLEIYNTIMEPSFSPLLQMMLNGMPLDLTKVSDVKELLETDLKIARDILSQDPHVQLATRQLRLDAAEKYNATHKTIKKTQGDFMDLKFNPNSSNQLRILLFDVMGFEPVDFTEKKMPKTDRASIKEFLEFAEVDQKPVLDALVTISQAGIVLNTFINVFEELSITQNGVTTLHGSLVLGGTQSSRMSSRDPNTQNLPSNSTWGKAIKSCFQSQKGWLFCGSDFNALEAVIGSILSKDPVSQKILLDGYDSHAYNAAGIFKEELEELGYFTDMDSVSSVNKIKEDGVKWRQEVKKIVFLKQYGGGAGKIQKSLKCSREKAQAISDAYDNLYKVTLQFNAANEAFAKKNGYVECAFGMRLQTPRINSRDSGTASAEARSSNNAVTQSWGTLMNRAFIEFSQRVEKAKLTHSIKLLNSVHDSVYLAVKNDATIVDWVNKNLIECMKWQEHPMLSSSVKLGAMLDVGLSWDKQHTLKNDASIEDIIAVLSTL